MNLDIELNESEIHAIRLAISTTRAGCDRYLAATKVNADCNLTQTAKRRALQLDRLALRFADLAAIPTTRKANARP